MMLKRLFIPVVYLTTGLGLCLAHQAKAQTTFNLDVNRSSLTVSTATFNETYSGSPLSPTVTTSPAGLSYSLTGAPATNASSYPVSVTITDPNYTGAASETFVITPAAATVTISNLSISIAYNSDTIDSASFELSSIGATDLVCSATSPGLNWTTFGCSDSNYLFALGLGVNATYALRILHQLGLG